MDRQLEPVYHGEPDFVKNVQSKYDLIDSFEFGKYSIELRRKVIKAQFGFEENIVDVIHVSNRRMFIVRSAFNKIFSNLQKGKATTVDIIGSYQVPNIKEVQQEMLYLSKDLDKYQIGCEFFEEQELKNLQSLINYKFNNI